jgi:hypothetical protein
LLQSEDEVQQSYRSIQQRVRDFCAEYGQGNCMKNCLHTMGYEWGL